MREKLIYIVCWAFVTLLFSCSNDAVDEPPALTRSLLSVGLVDEGDADRQEEIKTIRFIVFNDVSGGMKLDVNERVILANPTTATDIKAHSLKVTPDNDIMVIVIVNEPHNLTGELDRITTLGALQEVNYDITSILNSDGEVIPSTGMPMTGVIRDISILPDETQTVKMVIERAVARVDIFLEAIDGGAITGYTAGSTSVTLHNFTRNSYFVMGNEANGTRDNVDTSKNYGKVVESVSTGDLLEETWTAKTEATWSYSSASDAKNKRLLCSFYVAERIFRSDSSDQLAVSMVNVLKGPPSVTGIAEKVIKTITKVDNSGTPTAQPFTEIRRNNVYQITARVGKIGIQIITISVEGWGKAQDIDLDMYL